MRRIYLLLLGFALLTTLQAQELTVKSMAVAGNDISASQYRVNDFNGQPCALVKVQLATPGAKFEGNVIPPVKYGAGEYWVYMSAGSKELRIKGEGFVASHVIFSEYGIGKLDALATYNLTLLLPQERQPQKQKLIVNYAPASALVIIDSKPYQGNGRIELELPIGSHDYQIVAVGYETAEGSVKLANTPRTINETLAANAVTQLSNAQQQSTTQQVQSATIKLTTPNPALETFTVNGVSFNMVCVDGGTFTMGATPEQGSDAGDNEKPPHQVTLSTYSIGETEVTQSLWQAVMGKNPSKFKGANRPVEKVNWKDCQEFIKKLNELTGRFFRLPTEAEWEYAARGGNKSLGYRYSGSNKIDDVAWYSDNSEKQTHVVKSKQPNELGIYDMSGNVYEWCQDRYDKKYYGESFQSNPTGSSSGSYRVARGGSWGLNAGDCRLSYRSGFTPSARIGYLLGYLGLRLAL